MYLNKSSVVGSNKVKSNFPFRFHSSHPLDTIHNPAITNCSAAVYKGDDDSNIYDLTDSIYETIMDDNSPYSELPQQPPLASESHIHTKQPPVELQKSALRDDDCNKAASIENLSQCSSPVPYDIVKHDITSSSDYDMVSVGECEPFGLESLDDYVPMFCEDDTSGADKSTSFYQNLLTESRDTKNVYQVPRPGLKKEPECGNKDEDMCPNDINQCGITGEHVSAAGENEMKPEDAEDSTATDD